MLHVFYNAWNDSLLIIGFGSNHNMYSYVHVKTEKNSEKQYLIVLRQNPISIVFKNEKERIYHLPSFGLNLINIFFMKNSLITWKKM